MTNSRRDFFKRLLKPQNLAPLAEVILPLDRLSALTPPDDKLDATPEEAGLALGQRNQKKDTPAFLCRSDAVSESENVSESTGEAGSSSEPTVL